MIELRFTAADTEVWYGRVITPVQQIINEGHPILILAVRPIGVSGSVMDYGNYKAHFDFNVQHAT